MSVKHRVLITGTSGLIGSAVAKRIAGEADVVGLDCRPGPWTSVLGDIVDPAVAAKAVDGCDAIIHIAGLHAPHVRERSARDFRRINVKGTDNLLRAAIGSKVKRFVFTSTTSIYGCTSRARGAAVWVDENLEPHPEDIYDETKLEAERLCGEAAASGLGVAILRMSRCFPEPDGLVPFYRLFRGVDRRDVAEGHWLAATVPFVGPAVLNLSADPVFRREDAIRLWDDPWSVIDERAPGTREIFLQQGWRMPERIDRIYDIAKAKMVLGYRPRHGFREAIEDMNLGTSFQ
jgi:nucleoside-diphosphate-sugar epimerase